MLARFVDSMATELGEGVATWDVYF